MYPATGHIRSGLMLLSLSSHMVGMDAVVGNSYSFMLGKAEPLQLMLGPAKSC